jgi:hypothetical protein
MEVFKLYTMAECLRDYYSPLDKKILHVAGKVYPAHKGLAEGFYGVECEQYEGQMVSRTGIQESDRDYIFM